MVYEETQVGIQVAAALEQASESADRHIGKRQKVVELDPEELAQLLTVAVLEFALGRR